MAWNVDSMCQLVAAGIAAVKVVDLADRDHGPYGLWRAERESVFLLISC